MKVYLRGGRLNERIQEVCKDSTAFIHLHLVGESRDAYWDSLMSASEMSKAGSVMFRICSKDVLRQRYIPTEGQFVQVGTEVYPLWVLDQSPYSCPPEAQS